jgi:hypothetical protein
MNVLYHAGDIERALLAAPRDQTNRVFVAAWLGWRCPGQPMPKPARLPMAALM